MDATAIADYFAPLKKWLDEQNQGKAGGLVICAPSFCAPGSMALSPSRAEPPVARSWEAIPV